MVFAALSEPLTAPPLPDTATEVSVPPVAVILTGSAGVTEAAPAAGRTDTLAASAAAWLCWPDPPPPTARPPPEPPLDPDPELDVHPATAASTTTSPTTHRSTTDTRVPP